MFAIIVLSVVIGLTVLTCAVVARARAGALPRSLVVEYAPRRDASVLTDAVLAGQERRAAAAGLIDLAVRRKVRLIADTSAGTRATVGAEVVDGAVLSARDVALLEALFGREHPGHRVRRFSKDRRAVGRTLRALVDRQADELTLAGMIAGWRPGRTVLRVLGVLGLLWTVVLALIAIARSDDIAAMITAGGAVATAIAALAVTPNGRARRFTAAADPRRTHLDGMRQYLTVAEADRIRALQTPRSSELLDLPEPAPTSADGTQPATEIARFHLHERLLPYAILFGIEREWMRHLKLAYDELGATSIDAIGATLDVTGELLNLIEVVGTLAQLAFAVGDLVEVGGGVLEVIGDVAGSLGDIG